MSLRPSRYLIFFFFNDTATTEIYTLSLHDALPICLLTGGPYPGFEKNQGTLGWLGATDRKSTRLNSSHQIISYAVFCLKKKKKPKKLDLQMCIWDHRSVW